jgi:alpha-glucosidase (family GH31 glycosyl hydrolase)
MSLIPPYLQLKFEPEAAVEAVVTSGSARFTLLTSRLIRLEYDENGRFTTAPSQIVWYRSQPLPEFTVRKEDDKLIIETADLLLRYVEERPFTAKTVTITLKRSNTTWHYGDKDSKNLLGTTRTLDQVSGSTHLDPGLLSRSGWAVIDDSQSLLFNEAGWLEPRPEPVQDLYFFGYGQDYATCLQDYCAISGAVPMLPRWALGNWWSRYWSYTQDELAALMRAFKANHIPLSVCIVDMDWHLVNVDKGVNGWTGYTWNHDLFPDPPAFINWLHEQGLKTALNLHPALGVRPHEAMYPEMAARMGIDPAAEEPIPFDIANPDFVRPYFELLHNPQEADGVDFWWMDWQQGEETTLPGLDPLWWLNHLHFYDLGRDGGKRPFIFSRWGGYGNHRYPIGFSGDTHVNWQSLAFQPSFTAAAANVGYGWWSHDIGGHMFGTEDGELYARWVQFGLFSPILRLHSTKNAFHDRRPWGYDAEVELVARQAMQQRHAFIPYLYTMSWRNWQAHQPPIRPMYHDYPQEEAAYHCPQQYTFGTELIAAPYVTPADSDTGLSRQLVWLPEGEWTHFYTGETLQGEGWYVQYGNLRDIPVFAKAGAIVPLGPEVGWGGVANPSEIHLHLFAGADNQFTLYEDDGESAGYLQGEYGLTTFTQRWLEQEMVVEITAVSPTSPHIPNLRLYHLHLHGIGRPETVLLTIAGEGVDVAYHYNREAETLIFDGVLVPQTAVLSLTLTNTAHTLRARRDRTTEKCMQMLRAFKLPTDAKGGIAHHLPQIIAAPNTLNRFTAVLSEKQRRALLEVTQQAGVWQVEKGDRSELVVWNNRETAVFTYTLATYSPDTWHPATVFDEESGVLPAFMRLKPKGKWRLRLDYNGALFQYG